MAALPTAYILETSIHIGSIEDDTLMPSAVVAFGYKDSSSTVESYGGMSNRTIKTGSIPSECYVGIFDVGTAVLSDDNEKVDFILHDGLDISTAARVTPFEEIYMKIVGVGPELQLPMVIDGDTYTFVNESETAALRAWMMDNLNNTPAVAFHCYPPAPVAP